MTALGAFFLSHWRLLIVAGLLSFIVFQHYDIVANEAEIAQIREKQVEAVNTQLVQNSQTEAKWHNAITAGFQNYQAVNETTRAKYERQIAQLKSVPAAVGMQPSANEGSPVPGDTASPNSPTCDDRLARANSAVAGCISAARAADECQAKLELMWNSWPK